MREKQDLLMVHFKSDKPVVAFSLGDQVDINSSEC